MPTAQLPEKPPPETNGRLPDTTVLDRVRKALADADQAGERRPGRPTLMRISHGTDHQVRNAMAALEQEADDSEHQRPRPPSAWSRRAQVFLRFTFFEQGRIELEIAS